MRKFKKNSGRRSMLETLESRRLMAVIGVSNNFDSGEGSLRQAILSAAAGDVIDLSAVSESIRLDSELLIDKDLTLQGTGPLTTVLSGQGTSRVINVVPGATVTIADLQITEGGNVAQGGGIYNAGSLTLDRVNVLHNQATEQGGGVYHAGARLTVTATNFGANRVVAPYNHAYGLGGGLYVYNGGAVTIDRSSFVENAVVVAAPLPDQYLMDVNVAGGGIALRGTSAVTITNTTISGNVANSYVAGDTFMAHHVDAHGGGIAGSNTGTSTLVNVSVTNNKAGWLAPDGGASDPHVMSMSSFGGATLDGSGTVSVTHSLFAANTAEYAPDLWVWTGNVTVRNSLVGIADGSNVDASSESGNKLGTAAEPLDAKLGGLGYFGGPTVTQSLLEGSPAIDAPAAPGLTPTIDQRGYTRVGAPDIGAYEFGASAPVTNHAPAFTSTAPAGTHNAGTKLTYSITTSDADAADERTITASKDMPSWLTLTDNRDGTATLTGTPTNANAGKVSFELFVSDGTTSTTQEIYFTVAAVNHGPSLAKQSAALALAFQPFKQTITATDADGVKGLAFSVVSKPAWLTVTDNGDGTATLSGTPTAADNGAHSLTLKVSDGELDAAETYDIDVLTQRWTFDNGILGVYGSDEADTINVWTKGAQVRVIRNGVVKNFATSDVKGVEIYGFDGNDLLTANTRTIPVYALGNAGNDTMIGGDEPDNFVGGGGKDVIDAGGGDDRLDGFNGNDVLIGGDGDDRLFGGEGNDVLIGGAGRDELHGGAGDDHLLARDRFADLLTGGDGDDKAEYDDVLDTLNDVLAAL